MTSRNLAIVFILISAVAVAYLLGMNAALREDLADSQASQPMQKSLTATPEPTVSPLLAPKPTRTPKATPTPKLSNKVEEEAKLEKALESSRVFTPTPKEPAATARACVIIGNRNSGIYHLPGCPSYSRVAAHNREYYCTEEEAMKAGYRKARNC